MIVEMRKKKEEPSEMRNQENKWWQMVNPKSFRTRDQFTGSIGDIIRVGNWNGSLPGTLRACRGFWEPRERVWWGCVGCEGSEAAHKARWGSWTSVELRRAEDTRCLPWCLQKVSPGVCYGGSLGFWGGSQDWAVAMMEVEDVCALSLSSPLPLSLFLSK